MFSNKLTTSINNAHIKWKNSKTSNTPETISSTIFGSAAILIGECPLAGFKTVKVKP
jgi:hypothetical protein